MLKKIFTPSTILTLSLFIISTSFGIYTYQKNIKEIKPVYSIGETRLIFDYEDSEIPFSLYIGDSLKVNQFVYSTKIYIWNEGNLPIREADVRESLMIRSKFDNVKIVDCKIEKQNLENIAMFSVKRINDRFEFDWQHFDPGFGFSTQILFLSNTKLPLSNTDQSRIPALFKISGFFLGGKLENYSTNLKGRFFSIEILISISMIISISLIFFAGRSEYLQMSPKAKKEFIIKVKKDRESRLYLFLFISIFIASFIYFVVGTVMYFSKVEVPTSIL